MGLQGDQRALLQLLCQRGQSYEDIAGLLGGTPDDVRERARAALSEIGGADPDAEVGLTDYLLGQADPIGRADAIRHLQGDPEALALARRIQSGLAEIAPEAKQPNLPEPRGKRRKAALPDRTEAPPEPAAPPADAEAAAARRRRALIAGLAALGVVLVFAILAIAGVFSGSDSGSEDTTTSTSTTAESDLARVKLAPVNSSGVAGSAVFGALAGSQVYVDVSVDGLDPDPPKGTTYLLWLMIGDTGGFPLQTPLTPDGNGGFSGRLAVPSAIAFTVGRQADSVKVSETAISDIQDAAKNAVEQKVPIVPFTGKELASGQIPLAQRGQAKGSGSSGG